ncbi:MAG: DNA mismatch repair protein MutS [Candidatus Solibacter usitatus]|nr:DNA mismatch repair protein MutS [Candidatus Solibacter usitatus]
MPDDSPRAEYGRRQASRRAVGERLERRHRILGNFRLLTAIAAAILIFLAITRGAPPAFWLIFPACVFVALLVVHAQVNRERARCARSVAFYERALDRLDNRWAGRGETGERFKHPLHPYAEDLDLFGPGSLFELLSTARTRAGEEMLANWLRAPSPPDVLRARHQAVSECAGSLAEWGERPPVFDQPPARLAIALLSTLAVASFIAWGALPWKGWREVALALVLINAFFYLRFRQRADHIAESAGEAAHDLALLSQVLARLEREIFSAPRLVELKTALVAAGRPPSFRIRKLQRLMAIVESREHIIMHAIDPVLLWTLQSALAVESWRKQSGPAIRAWLAAVGEMEALSSLASYAYEHPADPFPEFAEAGPLFEGTGLAHPLLAEDRAVRNDVAISGELRLIVVSGSNMSGKSTLLRTVGINAVLAQCGAPVRAASLRISPLTIGASIRILDSLQDGTSHFYAEITRLKQIVDLTQGARPVLFLFDEFLQGTNSHDRRQGAEAMVRGLIDRGAIGFLTTHDLALSEIAHGLASKAANMHFEDRLENGKLLFDYHLRPGVVQRSNALELMRSLGLDV